MHRERWQRIEALFHRAVDLPPGERRSFLRDECRGDTGLLTEVDALVDADRGTDAPIGEAIRGSLQEADEAGLAGRRLGPYRVVRPLGRGGMGAVYLAERVDEQYRSTVAIKLIQGFAGDDALERFRRERQILADLSHPNIARLLDGGTTEDGLPYVVMEYVDGQTVDSYCDERRLGIRQRVALVREVAKAVEYAHSRLIVHRDIKPDNILVTPEGVPKLLDFGIAKFVGPVSRGGSATASETADVMRVLTPAYASPEQVRGEAITTATDVYGLAGVLYHLLAGHPSQRFRERSPAEIERVICETPPVAPSCTELDAEAAAARGHASPERLRRALRGDLDNIVSVGLRKEPERRYATVSRFSEDLRAFLEGWPVSARRDDVGYRMSKFVARHRLAVSATAAVFLVLVGLGGALAVQADRLERQRDLAEERRVAAEQVSHFLVDLFRSSDPNQSRGDSVTAREVLDRGAARIAALEGQPAVRATLENAMGLVYKNLGLYEPAEALLRSSLEARRTQAGVAPDDLASSLQSLGGLAFERGDYAAAEAALREAISLRRGPGGGDRAELALALDSLASVLGERTDFAEAEALYREALAVTQERFPQDGERVATALAHLADVLRRQGQYDEAERLDRHALAALRRALGDDHLDVAHSLNHLARVLSLKGEHLEALPLALEGLGIRRRIYEGPHAETAASLGNVAGILRHLGRLDESIELRRESLATLESLFGREHPYVAATLTSLGQTQLAAGSPQAAATFRDAIALHRRLFDPVTADLARAQAGLGESYMRAGDLDQAERLFRDALELREARLPEGHWHTAVSRGLLGECLMLQDRLDESARLLQLSLDVLAEQFPSEDERVRRARERLAVLRARGGDEG